MPVRWGILLLLACYGCEVLAETKLHCQRDTYIASDIPSLALPAEGSYIVGVKEGTRDAVLQDAAISGVKPAFKKMFMGMLTSKEVG
jgi:hypothetical protein